METHDDLERWVGRRMAASEPAGGWPDETAGWRRLDRRIARRRVPALVWAGAAAALLAVLAVPGPRAAAQRLWEQMVVGRIQVLTVDLGAGAAAGFFAPEIYKRPEMSPMPSFEEASRVAGFAPRLAGRDLFPASPTYSVAGITAARVRLRTPAIRYLVDRAGGSAGEVPDSWDGAVLEVRIGPVIVTDYNGVFLLQSLPFELITPADFDLERFFRIAFRALGKTEPEARALSREFSISPALLMLVPDEERGLVHEFRTPSGPGVMIENVYGAGKIVAVWSGSDRVYALYPDARPITREFILSVANAMQ